MIREKLLTLAAIFLVGAVVACTVDVEDPGSLPEVDVRGGSLPEIDIQPADIGITSDTQVVEVPRLDIDGRQDTVVRDTVR